MAYSEFYCDFSTGSNLNAGFPIGGSYPVTSTNGAYSRGTGAGSTDQFIAASGTPFSGCAVQDCISVYTDGASAPTGFVARITAINGGGASVDISLTAIFGTRPSTAASGITAKVGGAWKGPNGTSSFPSLLPIAMVNTNSDPLRVNLKNTATYAMTVGNIAISRSISGVIIFEGYTNTPGDGGYALFEGAAVGTSNNLVTVAASTGAFFKYIKCSKNGNSIPNTAMFNCVTSSFAVFYKCIAEQSSGVGFASGTTAPSRYIECEAYNCNTGGTANLGGFAINGGSTAIRCKSHHHTAAVGIGFALLHGTLINCISHDNSTDGYYFNSNGGIMTGCDAYNNGQHGIHWLNFTNSMYHVENCNFVKNAGWGIKGDGTGYTVNRAGFVFNCGFGTGTQANGSGTFTGLGSIPESGAVTYASNVTPWNAPSTGDFTLTLAAAKGTGAGAFLQTGSGSTGTLTYPNIGASTPAPTSGSPSGVISSGTTGGLTGIIG